MNVDLSIYMIILGVIFMAIFQKIKPKGIRVGGWTSNKIGGITA